MDNYSAKHRILNILTELRIDIYDYYSITYGYILARLNIKYSSDRFYTDGLLQEALQIELESFNFNTNGLYQEDAFTLAALSELLVECSLDTNYRRFFTLIAPHYVFDWNALSSIFSEKCSDRLLYTVGLILKRTKAYPFGKTAFTHPTLRSIYSMDANVFENIGLSVDEYISCWHAIHFIPLPKSEWAISRKIKSALQQYDQCSVPRQQLLYDVKCILEAKDFGSPAQSAWKTSNKKPKSPSIEGGLTEDERLFSSVAVTLTEESPVSIIHAAFYNDRDDYLIESGFVLNEFLKTLSPASEVLISNPSPTFLIEWVSIAPVCKTVTFIVNDDILADLYSRTYPQYSFITKEKLALSFNKYDNLLILVRDSNLGDIYPAMQSLSSSGIMLALLPETAITLPSQSVIAHLDSAHMAISRILSIPTGITQSTPRKKILLWADHQKHNTCLLFNSIVHTGNLFIQKQCCPIPQSWLYGTKTIQQLRNEYARIIQNPHSNHPNEPLIFNVSREIQLHYAVQHKRNRIIGRVCYRAILRDGDRSKKRGANLTGPPIERGLHVDTEEQLLAALEWVPFYENVNPFIASDINSYYRNNFHNISLKTLWICCYNELSNKFTYDHEIACFLLSGDSTLGKVIPCHVSAECFKEIVSSILPSTARSGRKYWQQLYLILQTAFKEGYISYNPVATIWAELQLNRASSAVEEVRSVMTRKSLQPQELMRMLSFLRESITPHGYDHSVKRYVAESKWFAPLFELFANVSIGESCLVIWNDLHQIADTNTYNVWITKTLNNDDSIRFYSTATDKNKCRYIPIDSLLFDMLRDRYCYLKERYNLTEEQLGMLPILLELEPEKQFQKKNAVNCSRKSARQARNILLLKAEIPKDFAMLHEGDREIQTDFNSYAGELLRSTYRYYASKSGFTLGELCYTSGVEPPDVYNDNYCEHTEDALQYAIVKKLNRWTSSFRNAPTNAHFSNKTAIIISEATDTTSTSPDKLACMDISLRPQKGTSLPPISIKIESSHGFTSRITAYSEEDIT